MSADSRDGSYVPARPWQLTAPESYVLRYAPVTRVGVEVLKLALQELVLRGELRVIREHAARGLGHGRSRRSLITSGRSFGLCTEPALVPLLDLFRDTRQPMTAASGADAECDGVLVKHFAKAARKAFGGHGGYAERHVADVLEQRGLLKLRRYVGVSGRTHYSYTAAGRRAYDELDHWMEQGKRAHGRADMRGARAVILLLNHFYPELGGVDHLLLRARAVAAEPADPTVGMTAGVEPPSGFALELDDIESLDSLAFSFAAFNGVFGGGDGGGGGGGGGDGGGA